jgi:thiosulfate dehydrogenase
VTPARTALSAIALLAAGIAGGCQDDEPEGPVAAADLGQHLFHDPDFSGSRFNTFACGTCHADEPGDTTIRSGYSLVGSAFRPTYWGGYEARLIDAVSFCLVFFMRGEAIDPADPRGRALYEYLVRISPDPEDALPLTVVANITAIDPGDARRGATVWDEACAVCHGAPHTGRGRISDLASVVPETAIEFADQIGADPDLVIIERVRHGQFFGVGGNMPLFSREVLSDEDLGALLAYLGE